MKASDNFKVDQAWWSKNKPTLLKPTGLGAVMKKYQDTRAKIQELAKKGKYSGEFDAKTTPFEAAAAILQKDLPVAVAKAKGLCKPAPLFKDTIAVLDKYKTAVSAEMGLLQTLEDNFNKVYKATYFDPTLKMASDIEKRLIGAKATAQTLYKETEAAFKRVANQLTYLKTLEKQGTLREEDVLAAASDSKADVDKVKKNCGLLEAMRKSAEVDQLAAAKIDGDIKSVLSFRDQDVVRGRLNAISTLKNFILDYASRSEMFQTGATSSFNEFKATATGVKTKATTSIKELKALQQAMTGNEFASRKLENAFTNILQGLPKMIKAIKEAPDLASIEVPAEVNVPVNKWEAQLAEWIVAAQTAEKKAQKIFDQSKDVKAKVLAKIDKGILESSEAKPILEDINSKLGGIEEYLNRCGSDLAQFQRVQKSVATELGKKK